MTLRPPSPHPTPDALAAFVEARGRSGIDASSDASSDADAGRRALVEHLEGPCVRCLVALEWTLSEARRLHRARFGQALVGDDEAPRDFALLVHRVEVAARLVRLQHRAGPRLLGELLVLEPSARRSAVRLSGRYRMLGFSVWLREESRRQAFVDVRHAVELARLAVTIADQVEPGAFEPETVDSARAMARAFLGNALRVAGRLPEAEQAFAGALPRLAEGGLDPANRAEMLSLLASLRIDQEQPEVACRLLEAAADLHRRLGDRDAEARLLLQVGRAGRRAGELDLALEAVERSLELARRLGDCRLAFWCRHNLTNLCLERGETERAAALFERLHGERAAIADEPLTLLRMRWLEGRLEAARGHARRAREAFEAVRRACRDHALPYDLALVTLDLALLHLERGDPGTVARLAREAMPLFRSQGLHRHAVAAVALFQRAAAEERVSAEFLRRLGHYLERARTNPSLRFRTD